MRRFLVNVAVPVGIAIGLGVYVWSQRDELDPLYDAPVVQLVAIGALVAVAHFLNSAEFWLLYRAQRVATGLFENWMVFFAANLGNYLPAQAGALYRVRYMKTVHGVSYAATAAVYGSNLIITLVGGAVAGLVGTVALAATGADLAGIVLLGYGGLFAAAIVALYAPLPGFVGRDGRVARAWASFREGFAQTRDSKALTVGIAAIEAAKYFVTALRFLLAFDLLGFSESYWFFVALAPAAGLAQFISFTPGALGFREGFLTATAVALGSPLSTGLLASTADRAVMLATSVLMGGLGFATTYPRLRRAELEGPRAEERPPPPGGDGDRGPGSRAAPPPADLGRRPSD